jgi:hypothetical protein
MRGTWHTETVERQDGEKVLVYWSSNKRPCFTRNSYKVREEFFKFMPHLNQLSGSALLTFDGHRTHLDSSVLNEAERPNN